jgi:hypothetical protein
LLLIACLLSSSSHGLGGGDVGAVRPELAREAAAPPPELALVGEAGDPHGTHAKVVCAVCGEKLDARQVDVELADRA